MKPGGPWIGGVQVKTCRYCGRGGSNDPCGECEDSYRSGSPTNFFEPISNLSACSECGGSGITLKTYTIPIGPHALERSQIVDCTECRGTGKK